MADKTARIEVDNKYVPISADVAAKLLSTYTWAPSVTGLQANISQYTKEFKTTGILDKGTDSEALAKKAFADVTGGDKGIDGSQPSVAPAASSASGPSASGPSASAAGRFGVTGGQYELTAAQRQELLAYACHHGASPAGRVV